MLTVISLSAYPAYNLSFHRENEKLTAEFDKPAITWIKRYILPLLLKQNQVTNQKFLSLKARKQLLTMQKNTSLLFTKKNLNIDVMRRGVFVNRFFWDISLNTDHSQASPKLVIVRIINQVGPVDPESFQVEFVLSQSQYKAR